MKDLREEYMELFQTLTRATHNKVFLKGNILLNKLLPEMARMTMDLDVSTLSEDSYLQHVVPALEDIGDAMKAEGLVSRYEIIREISRERSGRFSAWDLDGRKVLQVDIDLVDNTLGAIASHDFSGKRILGSSLEKIICDKALATLSPVRFRRMKDFYDLYIIIQSGTEYDPLVVLTLMASKTSREYVEEVLHMPPFDEESLLKLDHAWRKLKLDSFEDRELEKPSIEDLLERVYELYGRLRKCI